MIIDSSVLVDYFRGTKKAEEYLKTLEKIRMSRVAWMELIFGVKNKRELLLTDKQLKALDCEIIEVDEEISQIAGRLLKKYVLQRKIGVADSLIAATAIKLGEGLISHNRRHFESVGELSLTVPY